MKIRVLIVDDSAVIRTLLSAILSSDPDIEVVGTAPDPYVARDKLIALKPDVMTLDIEMPRMDGITFLEKIMEHFPVRTLIISSLSQKGAASSLRALELGAVDVLAKPALDVTHSMREMSEELIERVKAVARARMPTPSKFRAANGPPGSRVVKPVQTSLARTTHQILAIGASTGGTEAIKKVLTAMPDDIPGTLIVQHMPPVFTKTYAESLQKVCPFEVREAVDGDRIHPGLVLLAPGNFHMELVRNGAYYYVKLDQSPMLHRVRPAIDNLFRSVAKYAGANAIGVILTGMGRDGAEGLLEMKTAGSFNIAQDEASCIVFGMPKEAIQLKAAHLVLPIEKIADTVIAQLKTRSVA